MNEGEFVDIDQLPKVSVVFVTYDRLVTLRPTLNSFLANTDYPRQKLELIVTDDASPSKVQNEIKQMPFDVFCFSRKRGGLGANCNRGMEAATGELILQLQDDWRCVGPASYLRNAVEALSLSPKTGLVLLRPSPNTLPVRHMIQLVWGNHQVYRNRPDVTPASVSEHGYSDWPHLKRREFVLDIGPYREGSSMWETELDYSRRINAQTKWCVGDLPDVDAFEHIGEEYSYNWPWKKRLDFAFRKLPAGARLLAFYRDRRRR